MRESFVGLRSRYRNITAHLRYGYDSQRLLRLSFFVFPPVRRSVFPFSGMAGSFNDWQNPVGVVTAPCSSCTTWKDMSMHRLDRCSDAQLGPRSRNCTKLA